MTEEQENRLLTILRWIVFLLALIIFITGAIVAIIFVVAWCGKLAAILISILIVLIGFRIFSDWLMFI